MCRWPSVLSQKQNVSHKSILARHAFCMRLLTRQPALSPDRARALASLAWECSRTGLDSRSLEGNAALPAPSTSAAFPCLIGLIHVWINTAYMKTLTASKWLWFCFGNHYLAFRSMKLTLQLTNKVNIPRLSGVRNSWVGWGFGRTTLTKPSAAFGNIDPLKDDECGHNKTEGPKWQIAWVYILRSGLFLHVGEGTIHDGELWNKKKIIPLWDITSDVTPLQRLSC